ncbi:MAG: Transposase-like protein [candidate division CPR2 bacterium GW2011_GWC1_41_48]|uniref:Transposase-like protein n=1 Tax=candidate division CPR2 bacterium GW2011_GWC1_41_48 TaxID=1618344 RepID=A0A0G0Z6S2_UNCC2|nr:MAG: Transposase-like protein [candidate division CPR2 bacterium GW2011_GWC2_39_35]KKR29447.1 MAG: Transposase-like protein [candidate division CPR2 bacterium GW2011_GWD1_39_7]KKS08718.1 MAG: Transposase-like protein [candidate division CPR2 bacterium GW2011_GWC1_41_48]OGB55606.1 MAG: hypothetical protein A2Y27_03160 [candidate division CPR2 bacterium GWD1_39_7]OGB72752.1 MAG: hypothetical protein A2Y26_04750 [candidate division CPR2 bacterium GWD2_39_7]
MTRGNNRNTVFECDEDFEYYLELIERFKKDHPFDLYHYCLMSNHVHFLIKTNKATDFSNFMKRLNLAYFHHYRKTYGWVGHFWQDRFKSQPVGKDEYFIQCGKYIELNPVRAGIVKNPEDYRYSSYSYYAMGKNNPLLTKDMFYDNLGRTRIEKMKSYSNLSFDDIITSSYSENIWGSNKQRYREQDKINRKQKV